MVCIVLSSSAHATCDYGPLRRAGLFNNAMNFLTPRHQLLTLHRSGHGLSPMGWVVDETDFDLIADQLQGAEQLHFDAEGLLIDGLRVKNIGPQRNLTLGQQGLVTTQTLRQTLRCSPAQTGLFGGLDALVASPAVGELQQMQRQFADWLLGGEVDWTAFIGKGPGLTPSNDDTLVGMLLVAYCDSRVNPSQLSPFFAHSKPLAGLTTLVSHHYLAYAARGIFSSPLLAIAHGLLAPQTLLPAVRDLLNVGHYSGADALLGIWLAAQTINQLHSVSTSPHLAAC